MQKLYEEQSRHFRLLSTKRDEFKCLLCRKETFALFDYPMFMKHLVEKHNYDVIEQGEDVDPPIWASIPLIHKMVETERVTCPASHGVNNTAVQTDEPSDNSDEQTNKFGLKFVFHKLKQELLIFYIRMLLIENPINKIMERLSHQIYAQK